LDVDGEVSKRFREEGIEVVPIYTLMSVIEAAEKGKPTNEGRTPYLRAFFLESRTMGRTRRKLVLVSVILFQSSAHLVWNGLREHHLVGAYNSPQLRLPLLDERKVKVGIPVHFFVRLRMHAEVRFLQNDSLVFISVKAPDVV
jgi:hypothetical protein